MRYPFLNRSAFVVLSCGLLASPCLAIDYNEAVSGDFSNSGLNPTPLGSLTLGSNQTLGTTGRGSTGMDRDYFTFNVPSGYELTSLTELSGTISGGVSFIGLQAGSQVTVPTNANSAAGLLGWTHYSPNDINSDILPRMSVPSFGSSGFTIPLGAGDYSLWIQDFNSGQFPYGFQFGVQAVVPEPGSVALLMGLGLSSVGVLLRRRK